MIKELDTVVLRSDQAPYDLREGDIGVVVHCYPDAQTYEVEFVTADGRTVALATLSAGEIRLMHENEILHARAVSPVS
jgi:hypothetical protein